MISSVRPYGFGNINFFGNRNFDNRQKAIDKYYDMLAETSDGDCFCRNKKDCVNCSRKRNDFLQEKGLNVLDADEMEFMEEYPSLASLVDFDYNTIIKKLINNGYCTTGAHSIVYTRDEDGNFIVDVRATDDNDDDIHYIYSKNQFIEFMEKIKKLKQHLGYGIYNELESSYESLKLDFDKRL